MNNTMKRFEVIHSEGTSISTEFSGKKLYTRILMDKETGVQYLLVRSTYGVGLTPLLNAEGKPVIGTTTH